jgi:hypothetical protein
MEEDERTHHLPPASQTTAHGVGHGYNGYALGADDEAHSTRCPCCNASNNDNAHHAKTGTASLLPVPMGCEGFFQR